MMSTQQRIVTGVIALATWMTALNGEFAGSTALVHADECDNGDAGGGRYSHHSVARSVRDVDFWDGVSNSWDRTRERCSRFMQTMRRKCYTEYQSKHHTLYPEFPPHCTASYGYYETCWRPFPYMGQRCPYPAILAPAPQESVSQRPALYPPAATPLMVPAPPEESSAETPIMTLRPEASLPQPSSLEEPIVQLLGTPEQRLQDEDPAFLQLIHVETVDPVGYSGIGNFPGFRILDGPIVGEQSWQPSR